MIERIQIKSFKSVVDLEIELGKLNIFTRENGCGKVSILEAITFGTTAGNKLANEFLVTRAIRVIEDNLMKSKFDKTSRKIFGNIRFKKNESFFSFISRRRKMCRIIK